MKILVTGAEGMLGHDLLDALQAQGVDHVGVDKDQCDITRREDVLAMVESVQPTHVINCAAYTAVDAAEEEQELSRSVNVQAVDHLIKAALLHGSVLIQLSTDYVFDGSQRYYAEDADKCPINFYGQTKSDAEDLITEQLSQYVIVRTSWLFGHSGKNFVDTMRKLMSERDHIKIVSDQVGCPTYTKDIAKTLVQLVIGNQRGIFHVTNTESCSWFEFAVEIARLTDLPCAVIPCTSEEYPQKAKRPAYSVLKNTKLPPLRPWNEALQAYIEEYP